MDNHSLLQGIFSTQGSKLALLHFRQTLHHLSQQEAQKDFEGQPDSGPQASVSVGEREDLDMVISEVASTSDLCMTTLLGHARGMRAELTFWCPFLVFGTTANTPPAFPFWSISRSRSLSLPHSNSSRVWSSAEIK